MTNFTGKGVSLTTTQSHTIMQADFSAPDNMLITRTSISTSSKTHLQKQIGEARDGKNQFNLSVNSFKDNSVILI